MADENSSSSAPPENGGADPGAVSELQVLNGGIEIDVVKIDGSSEKVKVRQLPISLIGEWGHNQGAENEAYLVELLCDKVDRSRVYNLRNARMTEVRVMQILQQADFKQLADVERRLASLRDEIEALEAKERWSDTITDESAAAIRELGKRLNKKKFIAQTTRTEKDATDLLETMSPKPAAGSDSPNSSSPSPTSAESPSGA